MSWEGFGRTVVRGFRSLSNWEDSYFGGYYNVLLDYPDLKCSINLDWDIDQDHTMNLYPYSSGKLVKLFLLKVKEFGLQDMLVANTTSKKITLYKDEVTRHYLDKDAIELTIGNVIDKEEELKNMFIHYRDILEHTTFFYDENDSGEGDGKDNENDDKGKNKKDSGKDKKEDKKSEGDRFKALIDSVCKREPYGGTGYISGDLKKKTKFKSIVKSVPCKYSDEEELAASHLVKMLDISFDPERDNINSLRAGKLDVRKLAEIPSGNFNVYYRTEENQSTRPFSVCILGDESGSMSSNDRIKHQKRMIKVLYKAFSQILPQDRIYIYGHTSTGYVEGTDDPEVKIYHDKYNHTFEETIWKMGEFMMENYDGPVIEAVWEKVRSMTDDNIIFISLSDGTPCGCDYGGPPAINEMKRIIEKCKRDGFVTIGIGIQYSGVKEIYNYNTVVYDLSKDMVRKVSQLINHVVKTEFQS